MIADVGSALIKLASQFVLPILVEEAGRHAARMAVSKPVSSASRTGVGPSAESLVHAPGSCSVVSEVPGRLRLRLATGRPRSDALLILHALRELPGVLEASANPLTGNALVYFDPCTVGTTRILAAVDSCRQPHHTSGRVVGQTRVVSHLALVGT